MPEPGRLVKKDSRAKARSKSTWKKQSRAKTQRTTTAKVKGASKNSEFAQMQGAEEISQRRICLICKQEIFYATQQLG
jgi:hypothetical protein